MAVINQLCYPDGFGGEFGYYLIGADIASGVPVMRTTAVNTAAEIIPVTTTSAANCLGLNIDAETYVSTQATLAAVAQAFPMNTANHARILRDPFAIFSFNVAGSGTSGADLAGTACVVENTSASAGGTLITGAVGAVDRSGGYAMGLSGANKGIYRRISAWVSDTSATVAPAFPSAIAVGDEFVIVPISKASQALTLTSDFKEVSGVAAVNAGGAWNVVRLWFDLKEEDNPVVTVDAMAGDHFFSRLA